MRLKKILMGKTLLLWDFDGTLVNSEPIHHRAYAEVLARHGCVIEPHVFGQSFSLHGLKAITKLNLNPLTIYWEKQKVYREILKDNPPVLFDHIPEILEICQNQLKLDMVIVTNSYRVFVEQVLEQANLRSFFLDIYTRETEVAPKPSHELYTYALSQHHRQASEGLAFEDALAGMKAALGANLDVIWFQNHPLTFDDLSPIPVEVQIEVFDHESLLQEFRAL